MNIYDTKSVRCSRCGRFIGEIAYDAIITFPKCGKCVNPLHENEDKVSYTISKYSHNVEAMV